MELENPKDDEIAADAPSAETPAEAPEIAAPEISEAPSDGVAAAAASEKYARKTAYFADDSDASDDAEARMKRMSRRSFLWSVVAVSSAASGWKWLATRRNEDGVAWPCRRVLESNEEIARDLFSSARLAPTFSRRQISAERTNGAFGLGEWNSGDWQLNVEGLASGETLELGMKDIKALPRVEMITELKCIEGWSIIQHWAGARFADFAAKVKPQTRSGDAPDVKRKPQDLVEYVGMETPDGEYYVGLDMASALHPQTLLCYEMNFKPLASEHGAPLRLVMPHKYGIKNIKRIGTIRFSARRPADYWAEQGYDWYAGH